MAIDQNSIPKDLRPLNVSRTVAEEPRIAATLAAGRNVEGYLPNSIRDVGSPRYRPQPPPPYYPATVSETGYVGLGFGYPANPGMALFPRPPVPVGSGTAVTSAYAEFSNVGSRVGGNAAEQASEEGGEESVSGKKVKFLCSFGGKILPRPSDGMLRYVGGQTRIIAVRKDASFQELVQKMTDTYGQPVHIKYQLPDEDLDALVSVSCPEDLENMMEEYEKLVENSSDGSAKLRVFLFSASELDSSGLVHFGDLQDGGQRYVDAVNGIRDGVGGGITRKESTASAASTQNSDSLISGGDAADSFGPGHGDGGGPFSPGVLSPRAVATSQDAATRLLYSGPNPVIYTDASAVPLGHPPVTTVPLQSSRPEFELQRQMPSMGQQHQVLGYDLQQPSGMEIQPSAAYVHAYVDPHQEAFNRVDHPQLPPQIGYTNPQMLGIAGSASRLADHPQQVRDNASGVPSHQFIPAVNMTMASSSPYVNTKQNGMQQFVQPQQTRVEPYPEENSARHKVFQVPVDQNYKAYQAHLHPPQASVQLQAGVYGWHQVPPTDHVVFSEGWVPHQQGSFPDNVLRPDMCQTSLPHVHSDTLIQQCRNGSASTVSHSNVVFHSLHSEDNMRPGPTDRATETGILGEGKAEHQGNGIRPRVVGHLDPEVPTPPQGIPRFAQNLESQHDNGRILVQKLGNPDNLKTLFPSGLMGFPGDLQSCGVIPGNIPQSRQEDLLQQPSVPLQHQVKQETLMNKPAGTNVPPVRVVSYETSQPLVHESVAEYSGKLPGLVPKEDKSDSCISYDHLRTIDTKMEAIHISPPEVSGYKEQSRLPFDRPKVGGKEMFVTSDFTKTGIASDGNHIKTIEKLPVSSLEVVYTHNIQPVGLTQVAPHPTVGHLGPQRHLKNGNPHVASDEIWHGKPAFSGIDSSHATDRISPVCEWKDGASWFQSGMVPNDAVFGPSSGNASSAFSPPSGVVGDNWDCASSNSLFSNQDPWSLRHDSQFPPPRPVKVLTSKEALVKRDGSGHSGAKMQFEEAVLHQPSGNLNKDLGSEQLRSAKVEKSFADEHIKQELQAVSEGVGAFVLQSSIPSNPDFSAHEMNQSTSEANRDREVQDNDGEGQNRSKIEDIKTKLPDKTYLGFPISDGIGRLQIIKNSDLEELRELGSGTFGTVYHGKWRGSDVAIKRINDRCFAGKPSEEERMRHDFWNEAIKLADLHHPNVLAFYGVVLDGPEGSVATVTEYMVNGSLRNALQKSDKTLDKRKRLLIAMDVAFGMEYLHAKNIVHFDLKSDNLLVNLRDPHRPICKVGDLGLSKVKCQTLISGGVRGTLPWMAPELLNGSSNLVSEKVDVFSFGIVMWELLTGEEPYADLHYGAIIGGIVSNTLRPPVPETCDPEWRSLMERCWSSDPSERPSFTEIANQLRSMAANLPPKGQAQQLSPTQPQTQK
ncbi:PREDICTED: uncharacterized protein LOC104588515 isoform X2 [Nelumbo nucifera]|uniref:Uncharacterized protein LOC104588515 isoform X2 n=1 Tax=Nelumbo nucifera TaxID=4432 RepID=A0A1U7YYV7_NELNU|nr:PREDICTED: uncharacterized protein LOC104588515 isoform X2 [Nelumbo nucifera]